MSKLKLHYIHDPMCGWCYGAAPLIKLARDLIDVQAHAGGMMMGDRRQAVTPDLRRYVLSHDQRIAQLTGQPFGDAYANGLLRDPAAVLDSEPPIAAILAAEQVAGRGLDMLARVQTAHYVDGLRVADPQVLAVLAAGIGLDETGFRQAFGQARGQGVQAHVASTRALMARLGSQGFPTLALEQDQSWVVIDASSYYGNLPAWKTRLQQHLALAAPAPVEGVACGLDGCLP